MATLAGLTDVVRTRLDPHPPTVIFAVSYRLQVIRINAGSNPAQVVQLEPVGYLAEPFLVCPTVGIHTDTIRCLR